MHDRLAQWKNYFEVRPLVGLEPNSYEVRFNIVT